MNVKSRIIIAIAVAATAGAGVSGCQIFLPIIAMVELVFPHDKVPAEFKLPKGKRVLVFPDDMQRPVDYPPVKRALAEKVASVLLDRKAVSYAVPYDKLIDLRHDEPHFNRLAVSEVGKKLGADLVIMINIDQFRLRESSMGTLWHGRFSGKVRVVDVNEGRLWPDESAGRPVSVTEPICDNTSETYGTVLSKLLADKLGTEVAGLFHAHKEDRHRPKDTEPNWDE